MNKYTKEIAAVAAMALFVPLANADVNVSGIGATSFGDPGPLVVGEETTMTTTTGSEDNLTGGIDVPTVPDSVFTVTKNYSRLDEVDSTGATEFDNDGNVTLKAGTETDRGTSASDGVGSDVFLAAKFDVYPDGHPSEGLPIPGSDEYVLVEEDPNNPGTYIEVPVAGGPFADAPALEAALNALTPDDYEALGLLSYETVEQGTNGGNLQVGGDANVDGVLSVDAITDTDGNGLIRRDEDGSIHIGENSFILDDTVPNHILTSDSGTEIILGGDAPSTLADDSKDIRVANDLAVNGLSSLDGGINVNDDFTVDTAGNTSLLNGATLSVSGLTSTNGIANTGNVTTDTLTVNGATTLLGFTNTNGIDNTGAFTTDTAQVDGTLNVSGATTTNGLDNTGNLETDTLTVNGATTLLGIANTNGISNTGNITTDTLNVSGATQLDGPTTINNTLDVTGLATLDSANVTNNLDVDGFTTTDGLRNDGAFTNNGFVDINGSADIRDDLNVGGRLDVAEDVFVAGRSQGLQSQIDDLDDRVEENARGIAMVAALQHTTVLPGMTNALDVGAAHFEGETGMSINYARRINEKWQINFGAASTTDFKESVVKIGAGVQW